MDEKDCYILKVLHEEKNLTKTSERVFLTQPALTYRIQQIEKAYHTQLIIRRKNGIEFTTQGEHLVEYAHRILIQHRKLLEQLEDAENEIRGKIILGVSNNFARYKLPRLLKSFHDLYPRVEFQVLTGWSTDLVKMASEEEIHVGFVRGNHEWNDQKVLLAEESICIVSKHQIHVSDLLELPQISYNTDKYLKSQIDTWWNQTFSKPPYIMMEVDRVETCKEMVLNGLGYSVFPSICLTESDELFRINLTDANGEMETRKTWMIYHSTSLNLITVRTFAEFVKSYFRSSVTS